ncbi:MAG: hypothetical protein ABL900_01875 [Burkholderiaceae bacterium]
MLEVLSRTELHVDNPPGAAPCRVLSAASGLVQRDGRWYVVADDEQHLAVIDAASGHGRWLRLFDGELPGGPAQRKAAKPDLETLIELPALDELPFGALLALGSGSRPNRQTGVLIAFDAHGDLTGAPRLIDLAALYAPLRLAAVDLNIEGGFCRGDDFLLLQRANQGRAGNARIRFAWHEVWPWLLGHDDVVAPSAHETVGYALGTIDGVALGFSDAAALPNGDWVFSAVAEATADSYHDGACMGSVIGRVDADGSLRSLQRLEGLWKVEGIAVVAQVGGDAPLELTLITDADDRGRPTTCLKVRMSL